MISQYCKSIKRKGNVFMKSCSRNLHPIHPIAAEGFGGDKAAFYDSSRPSYSIETIHKVSNIINDNNKYQQHLQIVEVATGTGKFTRSFIKDEKVNSNQNRYLITEPIEAFISQLNIEHLQSNKWKLDKYITSSDKLNMINDNSMNAVIAAQSFHWMCHVNTLKEFHRVLLPSKPVILVWNSLDVSVDYIRQIEDIINERYQTIEKGTGEIVPRYRTMLWENIFSTTEAKLYFQPIQKWSSMQQFKFTQQQIMNHVKSISVISSAPEKEKLSLLAKVQHVLDNHHDTKGKEFLNFQYNIDIAYTLKN